MLGSVMAFSSESSRTSLLPFLPNSHPFPLPHGAALFPILTSCYDLGSCSGSSTLAPASASRPSLRWFSSSSDSSSTPPEMREVKAHKLPPVNPPDKENPDAVSLRAQWDNAVRLYGRMYSHAWGTAILAGVTLFGIGWYIKGENPLKALDPTGEIKKQETTD